MCSFFLVFKLYKSDLQIKRLISDDLRFLGSVDIQVIQQWHILKGKFCLGHFFRCVFLVCRLYQLGLYFRISVISIYIKGKLNVLVQTCPKFWAIFVHIDFILVAPFVKYIISQFYSHCTQNCISGTFWRLRKPVFLTKYISKSYNFDFLKPKKQRNQFQKNFHYLGIVGGRKLPELPC